MFVHGFQNRVSSGLAPILVDVRGIEVGCPDQPRYDSSFAHGEFSHWFSKIEVGSLTDPADGNRFFLPKVDLVQINLQDDVFVVHRLHDQGHERFLDLASERSFRSQEIVLGQLLGNR